VAEGGGGWRRVVEGCVVEGCVVEGCVVEGWVVEGWVVEGCVVRSITLVSRVDVHLRTPGETGEDLMMPTWDEHSMSTV
jgi:hypothetical protein